jgi:lysophospholipase L1-like esterase
MRDHRFAKVRAGPSPRFMRLQYVARSRELTMFASPLRVLGLWRESCMIAGAMRAAAKLVWRAALLAVAVIAVSPNAAWAQVRMPTHVACVGDSITYGYLASSSSKSYPSDLQAMFGNGVKVMNFGRNSATLLSTGDVPYIQQPEYTNATNFVSSAGASAVVDVIIMLGTNDTKSYNWMPTAGTTRAAQFMTDYAAMIDHFTNLSTHPVVYVAIPAAIYTNSFGISESVAVNEIDPIIRQVAAQKGAPIIDIHAKSTGHPEYFSDGVHPTDAGYMLLAQWMHDGLLQPAGTGGAGGGGSGGSGGAGGGAGRGGAGGAAGGGAGRGGSGGTGAGGRGGAGGSAAGTGTAGRGGAGGDGPGGAGQGGAAGASAGGAGGAGATAGVGGATAGGAGAGGSAGGAAGSAAAGSGGTTGVGAGGGGATTGGSSGLGTAGIEGPGAGGNGGSPGDTGGGGCGCRLSGGSAHVGPGGLLLLIALTMLRGRRRQDRSR